MPTEWGHSNDSHQTKCSVDPGGCPQGPPCAERGPMGCSSPPASSRLVDFAAGKRHSLPKLRRHQLWTVLSTAMSEIRGSASSSMWDGDGPPLLPVLRTQWGTLRFLCHVWGSMWTWIPATLISEWLAYAKELTASMAASLWVFVFNSQPLLLQGQERTLNPELTFRWSHHTI